MAHEVENMAYIGTTPWHGLGSLLKPDSTMDEWRIAAGMGFQIVDEEVTYGNGIKWPEKRVLYRDDTMAPLAMVSDRYKVVQCIGHSMSAYIAWKRQ